MRADYLIDVDHANFEIVRCDSSIDPVTSNHKIFRLASVEVNMRKIKVGDDESYKFWNIELTGSSYTVAWGRIGTMGQSKAKDFGTPAAAQKAYDKIIAEKTSEGYVEITPPAPVATTENVLEKAIAHDFDDVAAHAAFAEIGRAS